MLDAFEPFAGVLTLRADPPPGSARSLFMRMSDRPTSDVLRLDQLAHVRLNALGGHNPATTDLDRANLAVPDQVTHHAAPDADGLCGFFDRETDLLHGWHSLSLESYIG